MEKLCFGLLSLLPLALHAQVANLEPTVFGLSLEQLADIKVESASLVSTSLAKAPAIVSVITREEIEAWGDRSVADALARVPGLYRVDVHGFQDVGVRGQFGGQRRWNRQFKLLIDGQSQAFRPDASNFLSPSLLPMSTIDRIEVVRGPNSALYGADAFLGTVNIITRKDHIESTNARARFRAYAGSGTGVDASVSRAIGPMDVLLAVQAENYEINGLRLPASSPLLGAQPALRGVGSQDARQKPFSVLGRANFGSESSKHQIEFNYSLIDSVAEFLDLGVLTHNNRFAQQRVQVGWQSQWEISPSWQAKLRWNTARAEPSSSERLSTNVNNRPIREFSSMTNDIGLNFNWAPNKEHGIGFGVDHTNDRQESMQVRLVTPTGSSTLSGRPSTSLRLENTGVFAQYLWQANEKLGLNMNWRLDDHSFFDRNTNWRAAAVYEHSNELNAKLILSSSYKAPSVFDLYAQPLYSGDIVGNLKLRAETAKNAEVQVNWRPNPKLQIAANIYQLEVKNKIELEQTGLNYQPVNRGRFSGLGAELDVRYEEGSHRFRATLSGLDMTERNTVPLIGIVTRPPERFPSHALRAEWRWLTADFGQIATELIYASKRHASFSNSFANFLTPYSLAPTTRVNIVWTQILQRNHEIQLRVDNLLNARYSEPGYGGVDFPGKGRSAFLSYRYRWN
jgi:outer membrane receptor for ferrienterochelin and colicin